MKRADNENEKKMINKWNFDSRLGLRFSVFTHFLILNEKSKLKRKKKTTERKLNESKRT